MKEVRNRQGYILKERERTRDGQRNKGSDVCAYFSRSFVWFERMGRHKIKQASFV
jgi:hypothetical protein